VQEFKKTNDKLSSQVIVTGADDDSDVEYLPEVIDVQGQFMKIRTRPSVLRYKKYREDSEPHTFIYSELLLYHAWKIEEDLSPHSAVKLVSIGARILLAKYTNYAILCLIQINSNIFTVQIYNVV
jgi:hypothetical protein